MLSINTIETAMIVPMIFIIIFAFFEVSLFYLDMSKVSSYVSGASSYISLSAGKSEDDVIGDYDISERNNLPLYDYDYIEDEMRLSDRIDEELEGRLLLLKPVRLETAITGGKVVVKGDYKASHPLFERFKVSSFKYSINTSVELGDYSNDIRKKKVLKKLKEIKNE